MFVWLDAVSYTHLDVYKRQDKKNLIMIELQGITKSFGTLQVLKGIDLMIEKGEVVSIVAVAYTHLTTNWHIMPTQLQTSNS